VAELPEVLDDREPEREARVVRARGYPHLLPP
jgi:hypothetical protein